MGQDVLDLLILFLWLIRVSTPTFSDGISDSLYRHSKSNSQSCNSYTFSYSNSYSYLVSNHKARGLLNNSVPYFHGL